MSHPKGTVSRGGVHTRILRKLARSIRAKWIWRRGEILIRIKQPNNQGQIMRTHPFIKFLLVSFTFVATAAYGGHPSMSVTVFNAAGKVAFKGPINPNATFATGTL